MKFPAIYEVAMNNEEQTLIDGLFSRLQEAQAQSAPRDAQAEARINEHLVRQPAAGYYMAQSILVQEAAIKSLDLQNKELTRQVQQLQAELQSAKAQAPAPAPASGGFCRASLAAVPVIRSRRNRHLPPAVAAGASPPGRRSTRNRHSRTSVPPRPSRTMARSSLPATVFSAAP